MAHLTRFAENAATMDLFDRVAGANSLRVWR